MKICLELHRGLYPNITPHYPEVNFAQLLKTAHKTKVGNIDVSILNHEETLHYLYQHAFRPPLTYEPYKLISAADIISYTEKYFERDILSLQMVGICILWGVRDNWILECIAQVSFNAGISVCWFVSSLVTYYRAVSATTIEANRIFTGTGN